MREGYGPSHVTLGTTRWGRIVCAVYMIRKKHAPYRTGAHDLFIYFLNTYLRMLQLQKELRATLKLTFWGSPLKEALYSYF